MAGQGWRESSGVTARTETGIGWPQAMPLTERLALWREVLALSSIDCQLPLFQVAMGVCLPLRGRGKARSADAGPRVLCGERGARGERLPCVRRCVRPAGRRAVVGARTYAAWCAACTRVPCTPREHHATLHASGLQTAPAARFGSVFTRLLPRSPIARARSAAFAPALGWCCCTLPAHVARLAHPLFRPLLPVRFVAARPLDLALGAVMHRHVARPGAVRNAHRSVVFQRPGWRSTPRVTGQLEYQACTATVCFPPVKAALEWTVKLRPLDRDRAPEAIQHK